MNLRKFGTILGIAASLLAGSTFAADADFMLVNKTGHPIRALYISADKKDQWGQEQLGNVEVFANGKLRFVKFSDAAPCKRDVKVVFDHDASEATWKNLNLCEVDKLSLQYDSNTRKVAYQKQ
jgi:hypothetical protein